MVRGAVGLLLFVLSTSLTTGQETTYRLYEELVAFLDNADGKEFTLTLDVRDINHIAAGPSELLVKVYAPDGKVLVREVVPDDGVTANSSGTTLAGWDHEAWYYATCYSRGLTPMARWSSFSDPKRLAAMPKRTFTHAIKGGQKGVYRVALTGSPDHFVTLKSEPALLYGVAGGPDVQHGHGDLFRRSSICVPKGAQGISLRIMELDMPFSRSAAVKTLDGQVLLSCDARDGFARASFDFEKPGQYDDQVLTFEVSPGGGDYFFTLNFQLPKEQRNWRGQPGVEAVLAPDAATAKALRNGAIYHDGQVFWQMNAVRLYDWLKTLKPDDLKLPGGLPTKPGFISVGSHQSPATVLKKTDLKDPKPGAADILMHSYEAHKNRQALNVALQEMLEGMRLIGPNDHVMHGGNLAYEMGCYSYFYPRPAWRILQQSDAPEEVKSIIRDFVIQVGDRLAFARGIELVNGNSLASLVQQLRYCVAATGDPLQKELFDTYWQRFTTGGFGERIGIGASGGVQESFGYDHHYGAYVLSGWRAGLNDLKDERFQKAYNRVLNLYSYVASQGDNAAPWGSRTSHKPTRYDGSSEGPYRWKGAGGADFTVSVNDGDEFFAARRSMYYAVTYHGRLSPTWMGEGFHGQIGYGGGALCQLHIPGKGQVLASTLSGDYGSGMHPSQWRNFHLHSIVGETADGQPLVTGNSEHPNARLDGNTVTSSGEVRSSSVQVERSYTFGDTDIACSVKLRETSAEKVFGLYGGPHGLRGKVSEAYEMIPYTVVMASPGKRQKPVQKTQVLLLGADGQTNGPATDKSATAAAVLIDQGGYGVRIELDKPRPVSLGKNRTVLIQLVGRPSRSEGAAAGESSPTVEEEPSSEDGKLAEPGKGIPADSVSLTYRVVAFSGDAPGGRVGDVAAPAAPVAPASELPLAVLKPVDSLDKVAAAVAGQPLHSIKATQKTWAELRFAIAGDHLALDAKIVDAKPDRASTVWKGSCLEVFGAMPEPRQIAQLFLAPQVGDVAAGGFRKTKGGSIDPDPGIQLRSTASATGYELQALVPLASLGLDATKDKVLLEFQLDTHGPAATGAKPKSPMQYFTLFGSRFAYENSERYGFFRLQR